jgi:hypothetical protein
MMKSNRSEAAPGNKFIILQDDRKHSDVYEVAGWSVERAAWIRKEGEPIRITPTQWLPLDHLPKHRQEGLRGRVSPKQPSSIRGPPHRQ